MTSPPSISRRQGLTLAVAALLLGASVLPVTAGVEEALTLRVNDAIAEPGGLVALVLRTYAPRPIAQGQICFRATRARVAGSRIAGARIAGANADTTTYSGPIFASVDHFEVFSGAGDGTGAVQIDPTGTELLFDLESLSATINDSDGPLAVVFLRLESAVPVGSLFALELDPVQTGLEGPVGEAVALDLRAGELTVRAAADPYRVQAEGDVVEPGQVATLSVHTFEPQRWSEATLLFHYPASIAAAPPTVSIDPRYGVAILEVSEPVAGTLQILVTSADASLNEVPGEVVTIALDVRATAPGGTAWPVSLGPATSILDELGQPLAVALESGQLELGSGALFANGFESGDLNLWSAARP